MLDNFNAVAKLIEMNKQFRKIIKELVANGFDIKQTQKGFRIAPPKGCINQRVYFTHGGEACLHPIRRDFVKEYGYRINFKK
jgi:hypothetical protein